MDKKIEKLKSDIIDKISTEFDIKLDTFKVVKRTRSYDKLIFISIEVPFYYFDYKNYNVDIILWIKIEDIKESLALSIQPIVRYKKDSSKKYKEIYLSNKEKLERFNVIDIDSDYIKFISPYLNDLYSKEFIDIVIEKLVKKNPLIALDDVEGFFYSEENIDKYGKVVIYKINQEWKKPLDYNMLRYKLEKGKDLRPVWGNNITKKFFDWYMSEGIYTMSFYNIVKEKWMRGSSLTDIAKRQDVSIEIIENLLEKYKERNIENYLAEIVYDWLLEGEVNNVEYALYLLLNKDEKLVEKYKDKVNKLISLMNEK